MKQRIFQELCWLQKMMGKDFDDLADIKGDHKDKKSLLRYTGNRSERIKHNGTIKPFDLDIHKGEVIGLTGLLGSGRCELARAIYGADRAQTRNTEGKRTGSKSKESN